MPAALVRAGATVGVVTTADNALAHSRFVAKRWLLAPKPMTGASIAEGMQTAHDAWAPDLIIPAEDEVVWLLQRIILGESRVSVSDALLGVLRRSIANPDHFAVLRAKSRLDQAAAASSVDMAPQLAKPSPEQALAFAREHGFPVLIKPDAGWGGHGIHLCTNETELTTALVTASASRQPGALQRAYSVQKFIHGEPAAIGLAARDGRLLGAIAYAKHRTTTAHGPTTVARRLQRPDMVAAAERLVHYFGYTGFGGIDFVIESHSDRAWMIEFNARPSPICARGQWMGVDLAAKLVADMDGKPVPPDGDGADLMAFFPQEWYRDARSPFLHSAYHDVPWDDPHLMHYFTERHPRSLAEQRRSAVHPAARPTKP